MITEEKRSTAGHQDALIVQAIDSPNDPRLPFWLSNISPMSPSMPPQVGSRTGPTREECGSVHCETIEDFYFLLRLMFTYNQGVPGTIGDFLFLRQRVGQMNGHAGERNSVREMSDSDEYIQVGLHLLLFYIEVLLVVYRGEHRVEHFDTILELLEGKVSRNKLSIFGAEWDANKSNLVSRYFAKAEEMLGIEGMVNPPFSFSCGAVDVSKKWLDLWNGIPQARRIQMMIQSTLFHYLEAMSLEYQNLRADFADHTTRIIATHDTKQRFEARTADLSQRAMQLLEEGVLFVSHGVFDENSAEQDFKMIEKIIPFFMFINGFLLEKQLPWFSFGIEISMTRAGTAGSFGGLYDNFMRVILGGSGNVYGLSEPELYSPKGNTGETVSSMGRLIVNRLTPDKQGGLRELGMLEVIARILEENVQLFFHPLTLSIWEERYGFALEELIAEKVLESITLEYLKEKISEIPEFDAILQEINQAMAQHKVTLADLIPSDAKTIPRGDSEIRSMFQEAIEQAIACGRLLCYVLSTEFSELLRVRVNGFLGGSDNFIRCAESLSADFCRPSSQRVRFEKQRIYNAYTDLDYLSLESKNTQIKEIRHAALELLRRFEYEPKLNSNHFTNPVVPLAFSVAPNRIQTVFLADTIGEVSHPFERMRRKPGHQYEACSLGEITDNGEYLETGLHMLVFYLEVLLVVYRGEHRVENFEFIRELLKGNLDFGKLSLTGEEWDLECSTLVTSYLSQAVEILDIVTINNPPFTFCKGALSINKKWLDLWRNLPEDKRREMMTRIMLFHYLEGTASEYHRICTDLVPIVPNIIARIDTELKFRARTEGLSKRAKQLLQAGALFVTEGTFDEVSATKDYEMGNKIIPFLMHINGVLLQKKLPWFSSGIEIVMTRAGTAGSFGGLFNNLIRVTQGDSGNAYGVSEPATYSPQLLRNGSVSTWCKLIVNRLAPDGEGGIKELGMLEIVARILEENIQLFFHPLSLTIWKEKFGFSLEELIAEKVLESIKLGELNEKLSGVSEFAEISQEISSAIAQGKQSLADLIPSDAKTVPSGYATLKRIFGSVLQRAIDSNLLLDYLFCDKFSEIMDIQLNGYTGNYAGIRQFASELLESVVAGSCSPDSEQVLNVKSLAGCSVSELLHDIGFVADYGSQQSTEAQISHMNILATQILCDLEAKQHTNSAPQSPFLEAVLYVAPRRIQKVFLADTIGSTIA